MVDWYGFTAILLWVFAIAVYAVLILCACALVGANRSAEKRHGPR